MKKKIFWNYINNIKKSKLFKRNIVINNLTSTVMKQKSGEIKLIIK
jgi:hypothetical protein